MAARQLSWTVRCTGKDHENIGSDEFIDQTHSFNPVILNIGADEVKLPVAVFKWGGACRTEVHLNAIADDNGVVHMHGFTSFFEGDSEDTSNEVDREVLNFLVRRNTSSHLHPTVVGAHMQSGNDLADVIISMRNNRGERIVRLIPPPV